MPTNNATVFNAAGPSIGSSTVTVTIPISEQRDWYHAITEGDVTGYSVIHKFGRNNSVGTTLEPVCWGGIYRTPQVAGATTLRIKAGGNANDDAAGTGAREVTLQGIDANGDVVTEAVATAGASASSATTASFIRLFRAYVSAVGSYATTAAGSHSADIVIEDSGGTQDWLTISTDSTGSAFPRGQSTSGCYTIPSGYNAYLKTVLVHVDSGKSVNLVMFQRTGVLQTSAPYDACRAIFDETGVQDNFTLKPDTPIGPFTGPCDIGLMAAVATGSADVSVDFELILESTA